MKKKKLSIENCYRLQNFGGCEKKNSMIFVVMIMSILTEIRKYFTNFFEYFLNLRMMRQLKLLQSKN
jgi:hypothetical protein